MCSQRNTDTLHFQDFKKRTYSEREGFNCSFMEDISSITSFLYQLKCFQMVGKGWLFVMGFIPCHRLCNQTPPAICMITALSYSLPTPSCLHTHTHTNAHTRTQIRTRNTHTRTRNTHRHPHRQTNTHAHTHTCNQKDTHTHTQTHTHTHTHTDTPMFPADFTDHMKWLAKDKTVHSISDISSVCP